MKFLKEWINGKKGIECFDFDEFDNLEIVNKRTYGTHETLKKANWKNQKIIVVLKNLNNSKISESEFINFVTKVKALRKINHSNINRFLGLTRDSNYNYFSVLQYANGGNLRDYLKIKFNTLRWDDKIQMALDITHGLMYLHSEKIIHGNLHACNVLVNNGIMMMTDLRILKQAAEVTSEKIVYVEPQCLRNPSYEQDMKSDIYSLGVLLWVLSSGLPPFFNYTQNLTHIKDKLLNGEKEIPVANTPSKYLQLYQRCWQNDPNSRPEISEVCSILSQLKSQSNTSEQHDNVQVTSYSKNLFSIDSSRFINEGRLSSPRTKRIGLEIFKCSAQQIIGQFKLNHGLILTGCDIIPSLQGVVVEDGKLKVNLYKGQPSVYTHINSKNNDLKIDTCISFPVAEIIYDGNLLKSFLEYSNDEKKLRELCGDFLARRFLVGGQLFIKDFNSATSTQIDILRYYLLCAYHTAKYSAEIQFSNLFTLNLLPEFVTWDGKKLNTHESLINWMNNLYQKKIGNIISYDNLISISQLKHNILWLDSNLKTFNEKQPGVADFKEKLNLEKWVGDAVNDNLISWTKNFNLFQGLMIDVNNEIEISKKIPVNIIKIPEVNLSKKSSLKLIKPSTKLELDLISNHIFSIKNSSDFPFVNDDVISYIDDYNYLLVKCEKFEILLNAGSIEPTKEFKQMIDEALDSMKPLKALKDIFNEYGHLFPQRIVLGRSLKNILPDLSSFSTFDSVNDDNKIIESLDNLEVTYLFTQKGNIIEKNDLRNWIQNTNNNLEIVEFDNIIPLYKILEVEQQRKIDDILKNNYRIIMTGITDLKDLNNDDDEHYKRIDFELSLESEDYQVFGLIISEDNKKLEEIYVNFGLYDFNGFYAVIKKLEETNVDIIKCFVLWIVVGNPLKLSVFSPKNREIQVNYIKETVTLQTDNSNYCKKIPFRGYKGYLFSIHAYYLSTNYEPNNIIKLVEWKEGSINIQIVKSTYNAHCEYNSNANINSNSSIKNQQDSLVETIDIELLICVISTDYKALKFDHKKGTEYSLVDMEISNDFSSLIKVIDDLTKNIKSSYENIQYNREICKILIDRVSTAEIAINEIKLNKEKFSKQTYYKSFNNFINCLKRISNFINEISQLSKYKSNFSSDNVKVKFQEIVSEFDSCISDLNLAMSITTKEQMNDYMSILHEGIRSLRSDQKSVMRELNILKFGSSFKEKLEVKQIIPSELKDTSQYVYPRMCDGVIIQKKVYHTMDVACKPIPTHNTESIQKHLSILGKLETCPYIIQFYGLSEVNEENVMVFEWAEHGTLREVYLKYNNIKWEIKVSIARDICRGLGFLHNMNIFLHDLRCRNILIAEKMQAKIANFDFSHELNASIHFNSEDLVQWSAPEVLRCISVTDQKQQVVTYTVNCEVFSFGMLLWELGFQRIPYESMSTIEILKHVLNGSRESLDIESCSNSIQKGYYSIIGLAWNQEPSLRPGVQHILNMLQSLYEKHIVHDIIY
ncbi:hypothetical protein RclHR1_10830001 [Rhizophagus clarus]|uniref:Kinase-like domain-containing protein n=1 Tax=Rhizophagus clarus TaxID=94130 RepID=A0A2Z6Q2N4_9GLOM|nr:hypothetical protein RclHR1_10830001 [Rhizophagus clarus]GES80278.1 kinase-like domain-containing protein [Rhizophagus clarus]